MNDAEHRELREALGAYVLGQLPDPESGRLEAHLDTCAACRAEHADLLPVAAALSDVRDGLGSSRTRATPEAPPGLGDRVLSAVAAEEGRAAGARRRHTGVVAGLAAACAAAAVLVGQQVVGEDPAAPVPLEAVPLSAAAPGIEASADLVAHTWGVEVKLHGSGFAAGRRYVVTVQGEDGASYPAGEFVGTGSKEMDCNLNSSVLRDRADGFQVRDRSGDVVLASRF